MIKKKKLEMGENIVKSRLFRLVSVAAAIVLLLGACSNNNEEEAQEPAPEPDEQTEEIPELEEEEAEEVLQAYEEAYQNVIENAAEDGEVTDFDSLEELQEEFLTFMSEDLAADTADTYFEENEEGSIYIIASEEPVWFDEEETYELKKAEDNLYEVEQEQADNMLIVTYSIFWDEEKWIVSDVETEDIPVEENDGDTSNREADMNQNEQENNTDNETADQEADGAAEETNESTDEDTANNGANATEEENDQVSPDSEENNPGEGDTDTSDRDTSDDTDMDNSESNQNPESEENEEENTDENASSIDAAAAEKLVKEHLNMVDDSLEVVTSHQDEEGNYVVQVYELVDQDDDLAHTATYGWYTVDKTTREVKETEF